MKQQKPFLNGLFIMVLLVLALLFQGGHFVFEIISLICIGIFFQLVNH